jgi:hypothetical protein
MVNVALDTWTTGNSLSISMSNAPGEMNFAGTLQPPTADLSFQRKGLNYRYNAENFGMGSGNIFSGAEWNYPAALPEQANGHGYELKFASQFKMSDGSLTMGGFTVQTATPSSPWTFDLSFLTDLAIPAASVDLTDPTHMAISWMMPESSRYDAAVMGTSWTTGGTFHLWLGMAPHTRGLMELPELPASMSDYLPPTGGVFNGPLLFMADASWIDGYNNFAASVSAMSILNRDIEAVDQYATLKVAVTIPTSVAFKTTNQAQLRVLSDMNAQVGRLLRKAQ